MSGGGRNGEAQDTPSPSLAGREEPSPRGAEKVGAEGEHLQERLKSGREASHPIRSATSAGKKVTSDDNVGHRKSTQLWYMPAGGLRDLITSSGARWVACL